MTPLEDRHPCLSRATGHPARRGCGSATSWKHVGRVRL